MFNKLHKLTKKELKTIANKLIFTHHSKEKIYDRLSLSVGYYQDNLKLKMMIYRSKMGFVNHKNHIIIGINDNAYIVVDQSKQPKYICITYTIPTDNNYTIIDKFIITAQYILKNKKG